MFIQNAADFGIHVLLGFLGNMLRAGNTAAKEHFAFVFGIHHHTHFFAHTITRYHFARYLRGTFEIVGRTGGNAADKNIFGNASAKQDGQLAEHLVFIHRNAVALRQLPGQAQRAAARHDGYFVHRIGKRQALGHDGMPGFVISGGTFFVFVHHHAAPLGAHIDFVFGIFKVALINLDFIAAAGKQSSFVHQVGQIRAGKPGRTARQRYQIH